MINMTGHRIYTYSIMQAAIVMLSGILGLGLYINTNPFMTMFTIVAGLVLSFVFLIACLGMSMDNPLFPFLFREW